jgi:3-(3-hydroxy-phenyl)propionate hydroxylase
MTPVLVIGAGPVGLTAACELKRHGVPVRLIERKAAPDPHPNAAIVHVRTLEILNFMGAVDGFLKEGYPLPGVQSRAFRKRIGFIKVDDADSPFPAARTLGQWITERLLTEHFARLGGKIERQVEAIGIEQDERVARVKLRYLGEGNREDVAVAEWVIGCEGSKSVARETMQIPFEGDRYVGKEFLQVDAKIRWNHPQGYAYQFVGRDHVVFCFPYDGVGTYRIISGRNDSNPDNHEPPTLEEMQELLRELAEPSLELYEPTWFNRFRSGHRMAERFREGRVFLAGDAAHVHIPIGGQGMNYGMHDAFNLAWKLAAVIKEESPASLLDSYMQERHPVDESLIRGTDRAFHLMIEHMAAAGNALRFFGSTLFSIPAFQHRVRDILGEVKVGYPRSPLSEDHVGSGGPAAGDRAPDALVVRLPDRAAIQLFDLMREPRWHLFLFAGLEPTVGDIEGLARLSAPLATSYGKRIAIHLILTGDPPTPMHENWAAQVLMDTEQFAHGKYGVETPCLYLIRPDGYVAFRGGLEYQDKLTKYLGRVFA